MLRRSFFPLTLICLSVFFAPAQTTTPADRLAPGTILVASEKLTDPHFAYTVVLITRRDADGGIMGLILNRPMDLTVAKAFPQLHTASAGDLVYDGGPVSSDAVQALIRSTDNLETSRHILADIYSVTRKALLEKSINDHLPNSKFRVYLGYAGWGRGQLENELRLGAWTPVHGAKYVFDAQPSTLWDRLNRETRSQLASREDAQDGRGVGRPPERFGECCLLMAVRIRALCAFNRTLR